MFKEKYGFIVTKPLQLLIALSIIEQLNPLIEKQIIIVDSFVNSENVYTRISKKKLNSTEFKYCKDHNEAYKFIRHARFDQIFIDSDVGGRKFLTLIAHKIFNLNKIINLYEEGLATYLVNLDGYGRFFKLLKYFGIGTHFGESIFIDKIFLYQPNRYYKTFKNESPKLIEIKKKLSEFIDVNLNLLFDVFGESHLDLSEKLGTSNSCSLYLTEWLVDLKLIRSLSSNGILIVKFHPNIKENINLEGVKCKLISGPIPAEIIIKFLAKSYKEIIIYHHGSSAENYINGDNIIFKRKKMLSF